MRKALTIAVREYLAAVRTKSFIISLLLMPILIALSSGIQYITRKQLDTEDKRIAVIDRTGALFPDLLKKVEKRNANEIYDEETHKKTKAAFLLEKIEPSADEPLAIAEQRLALSQRVLNSEFFGFVEIGPDIARLWELGQLVKPHPLSKERAYLRYQTNHPTSASFRGWAELNLPMSIQEKLLGNLKEKLPFLRIEKPASDVATMKSPPHNPFFMATLGLSKRDPKTGVIKEPEVVQQIATLLVPAGLVSLMLMIVMLGSTPAMQGIVEEKMQRIAEVLLGSVKPFQMMLGKLLGLMAVSLTIAFVYLGGALWGAHHYGFADSFSFEILAWYLAFQILALLMYGSLFLAIGAAATDAKETQTLVMPIVLICCLPLYLLTSIIEDPNGKLATGISFFPFSTPMLMTARLAVPPGIPFWQPALGMVVVIATTLFCVYAAGRIFRIGILMQGKGPKFSDLIRWVIRG